MPEILTISIQQFSDVHVVTVVGEIDLSTAPQLDMATTAAINEAVGVPVVLDLTDVTFLSSNGIAVLLQTRQRCAESGIELRIVVPVLGATRRSLTVTGLLDELANYSTLSAALHE